MQLEQRELSELASFFAKRFGDLASQEGLVAQAGIRVDAAEGWPAIIEAAAEQQRLGALAQAALDRRPEDDNLREMAATLPDERVPMKVMLAAGAVLLALGLGAAAWYGSADEHIEKLHPEDEVLAEQVPQEQPPQEPVAQPLPEPIQELTQPEELEPAIEAEAIEPELAAVEPAPLAELTPPAADGRCGAPEGELVGYWYAGHPFEPGAGDIYTMKHGKYVRAGYPARENGWDHEQAVRCALRAGDRVRISHEPILVDGGKYWVPLHGGDLLGPG